MKKLIPFIFLIITICFYTNSLYGQDYNSESRKKVGIVLSGGGAKGVAHIGALKVYGSHSSNSQRFKNS